MMAETFNHGYALLIGVGRSQYEKLSLPVTVKDTQAIYRALTNHMRLTINAINYLSRQYKYYRIS